MALTGALRGPALAPSSSLGRARGVSGARRRVRPFSDHSVETFAPATNRAIASDDAGSQNERDWEMLLDFTKTDAKRRGAR